MTVRFLAGVFSAATFFFATAAVAQSDTTADSLEPPPHVSPWPDLSTGQTQQQRAISYQLGPEMQRGMSARAMLADRRRLDAALASLTPHRRGQIDAYVLAAALDSDPVFAREAREAGRVLSRRYDAEGRTLVLAGPDGEDDSLPQGSITSLTIALAQFAELMDPAEDVLVLFTTSHGAQLGLAYHDGDNGYGILSPQRLRSILAELGLERRILILNACYAGVFVPHLQGDDTAIATAAAHNRSSFGCQPDNDWTYFGDALVNRELRQPQTFTEAVRAAQVHIVGWELADNLVPSLPQLSIGRNVAGWLNQLEARMPDTASEPVGRPAVSD
ncbi:C13 family peptidase [Aurantiacibacter gilvus]|uniref:C13 family peptidase n=1 Tax=Aurantiacibacter gilvus TaxID=3139141 RepID=A0ABU9IE76_9SPHN